MTSIPDPDPSALEKLAHHLPESMQALSKSIGLPATFALVEKLGGRKIDVVRGKGSKSYLLLAEAVGDEAAAKISSIMYHTPFEVPFGGALLKALRNRSILLEFDRLTMVEKASARQAVDQLVVQFRPINSRSIWRILKTSFDDAASASTPVKSAAIKTEAPARFRSGVPTTSGARVSRDGKLADCPVGNSNSMALAESTERTCGNEAPPKFPGAVLTTSGARVSRDGQLVGSKVGNSRSMALAASHERHWGNGWATERPAYQDKKSKK
jgi:hypothetical protein